jgi:hypothetical protein
MHRRKFLTTSLCAGAAPWLASAKAAEVPAVPVSAAAARPPAVFGATADSMAILQALDGPASGYLEIGETPELGIRVACDDSGLMQFDRHVLKFTLPLLKPGQRYHYRLVLRPTINGFPTSSMTSSGVASTALTARKWRPRCPFPPPPSARP